MQFIIKMKIIKQLFRQNKFNSTYLHLISQDYSLCCWFDKVLCGILFFLIYLHVYLRSSLLCMVNTYMQQYQNRIILKQCAVHSKYHRQDHNCKNVVYIIIHGIFFSMIQYSFSDFSFPHSDVQQLQTYSWAPYLCSTSDLRKTLFIKYKLQITILGAYSLSTIL